MKKITLILLMGTIPLTGCVFSQPLIPPSQAVEQIFRDAANRPKGQISTQDYQGIHSLILIDKEIRDLQALPGLIHARNLMHLNLYDNQITDLSSVSVLNKLEWLNIGRNQVFDLTPLEKLNHLKNLYLYDNPRLSFNQIDRLQKALPKCKIWSNAEK